MNASAIVLSGGRSQRMGCDKASLPFGRETLLQRVVRLTLAVADELILVGAPGGPWAHPVRHVREPVEGLGPLAGLATGLEHITSSHAIVVACDMPLLVPAVLDRLLALVGDADACVPVIDHVPVPTCAVYTRRAAVTAQAQLASGDRSLRGLLGRLQVRWVSADELRDVDPDLRSFMDCDTPEDYEAALARLRSP